MNAGPGETSPQHAAAAARKTHMEIPQATLTTKFPKARTVTVRHVAVFTCIFTLSQLFLFAFCAFARALLARMVQTSRKTEHRLAPVPQPSKNFSTPSLPTRFP